MFQICVAIHTEKYCRNLIKSTRNQIAFIIFWLIWIQTDVSVCIKIIRKMVNTIWFRIDSIRFRKYLVLNQSKIGKYNLISVRFNKIWKIFLCIIRNTRVLRHPHSISLLASSGAIPFGAKSIGKMCNYNPKLL